jgi:hypothetical protein
VFDVAVINICASKLKPPKFYFMIADLNTVPVFKIEAEQPSTTTKTKPAMLVSVSIKVKQFYTWINPKNWFSRFSNIDIDMSEFACKKTIPKE